MKLIGTYTTQNNPPTILKVLFVLLICVIMIVSTYLFTKHQNNLRQQSLEQNILKEQTQTTPQDSQTNQSEQATAVDQNTTDNSSETSETQTQTQTQTQTPSQQPTNTPVVAPPAQVANWWNYPTNIQQTKLSGDNLLVLVNKSFALPSNYAPTDLTAASDSGFRVTGAIQLRSMLIQHLVQMRTDSAAAGIDLTIASGYRSYQTQISTYNYWVSYNGGNADAADQISARAGHSQHQLGTAIDFSTAVSPVNNQIGAIFNGSAAQLWLADNAWKYGFAIAYPSGGESTTGYAYESWHFRFIGVENAAQWHNSEKLLEVWLEEKNHS